MSLRLLHTSDWHLGHQLHGFDRAAEHARALTWLLATLEHERVDALLVAGDVFDSANPPVEAQRLWHWFLVEAWKRLSHLQIVVVGGNHDSPSRLEATDPFARALERLHVVGGVARRDGQLDVVRHAIPLADRSGRRAAWVAAVPHLRAGELGTGDEASVAAGVHRVYDAILGAIRARRAAGEALVALGHLYLAGGQVSSLSERRLTLGNESAVGHDLFPEDVAYAALGHLHLAQPVGGRAHVRYSGSLLPLALSERDYPHQVVVVELDGPRVAGIREVRAPRGRELPRIPRRGAATVEEALAALRALPARGEERAHQATLEGAAGRDGAAAVSGLDAAEPPGVMAEPPGVEPEPPLLEVEVRLERPEPSLRQRVEEALRGKAARLARLGVTLTGSGRALGEVEARALADLAPEDVLRAKWRRAHQGEPGEDLLATFRELLELVHQESR